MRRTTTLPAACLLGLTLLVPAAANAGGETCRGEAATIVGTGDTITGTEGRDVVVTGAADGEINTLGGDDLICVVPERTGSNFFTGIYAGPGNDIVDATAVSEVYYLNTVLGTGADSYFGGAAGDTVFTGETPVLGDVTGMTDTDIDTVETGAGNDRVLTGSTAGPNHDVIDTGQDNDGITLTSGALAADGQLSAGTGLDVLTIRERAPGDVTLDLAAQSLTTVTGTASFSSIEEASIYAASGRVTVRGTDGDDRITVVQTSGAATLDLVTLAGDDEVLLQDAAVAPGTSIDVGEGEDRVAAGRESGRLGLDVKKGRLSVGGVTAEVLGLENAFLLAPGIEMVGDSEENQFFFVGCNATVSGGGGNDEIISNVDYIFELYEFRCKQTSTLKGGSGDDHLIGGEKRDLMLGGSGKDRLEGDYGDDRLRGGGGPDTLNGNGGDDDLRGDKGRDLANGGTQRDLCRAERTRRCER